MNLDYDALQKSIRKIELMWNQIAHERVDERLDMLFRVSALMAGLRSSEDETEIAYSKQASSLRHSTSRIPPRELEDAVFTLENRNVQQAFDIYCDETPERQINDAALLWAVYTVGPTKFMETKILTDTCFKLDKAQPALGLNVLRPDAERFFSYQSQGLRTDFPVVIRIVDRLKEHWREKIHALAQQLTAKRSPSQAGDKESGQVPNVSPTSGTVNAGIKDDSRASLPDLRGSDSQVRPTADAEPRRGRPREDALAERVKELRGNGRSWAAIKIQLDRETGTERTIGAYRSLYTTRNKTSDLTD